MRGTSSLGGHLWILDGLIVEKRTADEVYHGVLSPGIEQRYLIHCNWGWGSYGDGYYASGFFDATEGRLVKDESYDGPDSGSENFCDNLKLFLYSLK